MAIETDFTLSANKKVTAGYVRVSLPRSNNDKGTLKLLYTAEYFTEPPPIGSLIRTADYEAIYQGSDIWNEAYTNLKTINTNYKDV